MSSSAPLFIITTVSGLQSSQKVLCFSAPDHTLNIGGKEIFCGLDFAEKSSVGILGSMPFAWAVPLKSREAMCVLCV